MPLKSGILRWIWRSARAASLVALVLWASLPFRLCACPGALRIIGPAGAARTCCTPNVCCRDPRQAERRAVHPPCVKVEHKAELATIASAGPLEVERDLALEEAPNVQDASFAACYRLQLARHLWVEPTDLVIAHHVLLI